MCLTQASCCVSDIWLSLGIFVQSRFFISAWEFLMRDMNSLFDCLFLLSSACSSSLLLSKLRDRKLLHCSGVSMTHC